MEEMPLPRPDSEPRPRPESGLSRARPESIPPSPGSAPRPGPLLGAALVLLAAALVALLASQGPRGPSPGSPAVGAAAPAVPASASPAVQARPEPSIPVLSARRPEPDTLIPLPGDEPGAPAAGERTGAPDLKPAAGTPTQPAALHRKCTACANARLTFEGGPALGSTPASWGSGSPQAFVGSSSPEPDFATRKTVGESPSSWQDCP